MVNADTKMTKEGNQLGGQNRARPREILTKVPSLRRRRARAVSETERRGYLFSMWWRLCHSDSEDKVPVLYGYCVDADGLKVCCYYSWYWAENTIVFYKKIVNSELFIRHIAWMFILELERFRLQKNRDYKYFANFDPLITIRLLWQKVIYTVVIDYLWVVDY